MSYIEISSSGAKESPKIGEYFVIFGSIFNIVMAVALAAQLYRLDLIVFMTVTITLNIVIFAFLRAFKSQRVTISIIITFFFFNVFLLGVTDSAIKADEAYRQSSRRLQMQLRSAEEEEK